MNEVKASNKTSDGTTGGGGNSGLMTADDKAKLDTIAWNANNYTLPTADNDTKGGVILGASKVYNLDTPSAKNDSNRYYPIQTDKHDKLVVNVPWNDTDTHWSANLKVGTSSSTNNDATTGTVDTYIKVVENSTISSLVKVVGSGGTTVSSSNTGELTISSPKVPSYSILKTDKTNSNNLSTTGYRVFGPGSSNANTNNYLAGNGTWVEGWLVPIPTDNDKGKYLKFNNDGVLCWATINTTVSSE